MTNQNIFTLVLIIADIMIVTLGYAHYTRRLPIHGLQMEMTIQDFVVGERVEYILPCSPRNGRDTDWFLAATITKITKNRLVLRLDKSPQYVRVTTPKSVRKIVS